jgi:4-amino-4-deoxy-L-arabinose transferase-like glycosyltransferase
VHPLYHKYKDRDFIYLIPLVLLSLAVRWRYFFKLWAGPGFPKSDDSIWYISYAYSLMADFKIGLDMNDILYVGYNILLTLLLALFKDPITIIFIQATTAGLSVILVYKIAQMLFNRRTAVIASIFYSFSWGITLWSMYILSDSFFISLLLLCVYFLLMFLESNKRRYQILFVTTSLYLLVFKPTGIITLVFILVYFLYSIDRKSLKDFAYKYRVALGCVAAAGIAVCMYILAGAKLDPLIASLQFNAKKVLYNIYAAGWIYDKPSPYDHPFKPDYTINILNSLILSFIINNWDQILILYGRRTAAFLGRWVWETDLNTIGGIIKFAWYLSSTALFFVGSLAALWNGLFRKSSILWLIILSIFVFCIIFFIDVMYRYKAPALPFLVIVAAYGSDRIIQGAINLAKKYTFGRV